MGCVWKSRWLAGRSSPPGRLARSAEFSRRPDGNSRPGDIRREEFALAAEHGEHCRDLVRLLFADGLGARHRSPDDRACSRMRRRETQLPDTAPGTDGRLPERCDPRPSECPTGACHRLPLEYRPAAPAEENSSLTTAGSTACRGCSKINLEVCDRLSVYSSRSVVGLHTFEGFPDFPLGDVERLCLAHGLLPSPVGPWPRLNHSPFGPAPLQSLHPYYELLRPCAPLRYSGPCGVRRLDVSLGIGATGSHVPYKSLVELRAAYMPDAARAGFRVLPS